MRRSSLTGMFSIALIVAAHGAAPDRAADDALSALRAWFDAYRHGHKDLYGALEIAAPTADGARYYKTEGVDELKSRIDAVVDVAAPVAGADAASLLLDVAVFVADRNPNEERARFVRSQPWVARRLASDALARLSQPAALEYLRENALTNRAPLDGDRRRATAATALAAAGDTGAAPSIRVLLADPQPSVRAAAASALGRLRDRESFDAVAALLDDPVVGVRLEALVAVDAIASSDPALAERRGEILRHTLGDAEWTLRLYAAERLAAWPDKASIGPLLTALEHEQPGVEGSRRRVRAAVRHSLGELTGQDFPSQRPSDWSDWWAKAEAGFELPKTPRKLDPEQGARFFGLALDADEVVYLLDASGSMNQPLASDPSGPSRFRVAARELERSIEGLGEGTRFNVVLFSESILPYAATPVVKTGKSAQEVGDFLDAVKPEGGTDLFGALDFALGLKRQQEAGELLPPDVDTLVLVTDGVPSRGPILIGDEIVAEVKAANRGRRIAIHTVCTGKDSSDFLRALAESTGGRAITVER